jgi:hypothetical protein
MAETDWQITATTVYCEAVDDEVTLLVYADGTAKCTGLQKYAATGKKKDRATRTGKKRRCREVDCTVLTRYRDSLLNNQKASK